MKLTYCILQQIDREDMQQDLWTQAQPNSEEFTLSVSMSFRLRNSTISNYLRSQAFIGIKSVNTCWLNMKQYKMSLTVTWAFLIAKMLWLVQLNHVEVRRCKLIVALVKHNLLQSIDSLVQSSSCYYQICIKVEF